MDVRKRLRLFKVLDPACGSGNFLYLAYRELKKLETALITRIRTEFPNQSMRNYDLVTLHQFYGIDKDSFGVELAKVTLVLAKEVAIREASEVFSSYGLSPSIGLRVTSDKALPLDNLDENIKCADAVFCPWPKVDAIIGNPPYQSKNKMQKEFGPHYLSKLREKYPAMPGRADYCVYWFRRAHDELPEGGRAGLVGTNTIKQNNSREGGLDYIVANGGTITEAVSSQVWSGVAVVHVSIVNWIKGKAKGKKKLSTQRGDLRTSPWEVKELDFIGPSLSEGVELSSAAVLQSTKACKLCFQGQTHGHEAFILSREEVQAVLKKFPKSQEVLFPYLIIEDILKHTPPRPQRYVIDFHPRTVNEAVQYPVLFERIKNAVLPARQAEAKAEAVRNAEVSDGSRVNKHHANFLKRWWLLSFPRPALIKKLSALTRYIACGRITKRPIFEFFHPGIRPNDLIMVFTLEDDYSFGILQSDTHWRWFAGKCSTMKRDPRYTSESIFDTFPWPQNPTSKQARNVANAGIKLRKTRWGLLKGTTFRELYRTLELSGANPLKDAHQDLDEAVREAYGASPEEDTRTFLLQLNHELAEREKQGEAVVAPGLPPVVKDSKQFVTADCVKMP